MKNKRGHLITIGAVLSLVILSFIFIPFGSDGLEHQATVRIEYSGGYFGSIRGYETIQVEGSGNRDFDVEGDIIYVIITKADSGTEELKASIIVNGGVRVSDSTTEPNGEVRISFSFGSSENGDNESSKGVICVSLILPPVILLMVGVFILAERRNG